MEEKITRKKALVLVQLGSPASTKTSDVRKYLKEFLGDPRVVDLPAFFWKIILNLFVLPFRPAKSAKLYKRIVDKDGKFPLIEYTKSFAHKVNENMGGGAYACFILSPPRVVDIARKLEEEGVEEVTILPLFPQYSESTTASVFDMSTKAYEELVNIPSIHFIANFHRMRSFIDLAVNNINDVLKNNQIDHLIISFHGIPTRRVVYKKDRYFDHCMETFALLKKGIEGIDTKRIHVTFQSRFGSEPWLQPYTDAYACDLAKKGEGNIAVYCPSFVVDCLETTDEIGNELGEELEELGGKVYPIPCLNDDDTWAKEFADFAKSKMNDSKTEQAKFEYSEEETLSALKEVTMPKQEEVAPPLSKEAKKTIKILFLTLFLDLVGFSIIFPLFPALAKHYLEVDPDNFFLRMIFDGVTSLTGISGANSYTPIVLFGGVLGALYSLLQFFAAPFWGSMSDKYGRKPILIISIAGLAFSYLLWIFSKSFTLLILARFIGGIMAGNISTATAVIADVTEEKNRSKGMAFVGIAFAFGFILGPAMGGILSFWDLSAAYPSLVQYGVNPFSAPALLAFVLSVWNIYFIITKFKESLPPEKRGKDIQARSANPFKLFKPLPFKGFNEVNFGHFLFLAAFSGMEFTLTFLAVERLSYSSMDNAYMFIYIGFIIALVQGGYVRRKAAKVGEKRMAIQGLIFLIPGLLAIGLTSSTFLLYAGLFFLAVGSSMAIPCLTSLASLYSPAEQQGRALGVFRSLGALARVLGPTVACLVYWQWGSAYPYFIGAAFLIIPIILISKLPKVA